MNDSARLAAYFQLFDVYFVLFIYYTSIIYIHSAYSLQDYMCSYLYSFSYSFLFLLTFLYYNQNTQTIIFIIPLFFQSFFLSYF